MELFKLFGTIALNNSDANKGIEKTTNLAEGAAQKIGTAFEKVGSAAVAVGKTVAVGMGAAATAISALTKEAVQGYADYEQLVGGVDTLFKNFSGLVQRNAENAYKTAGLSANEYMETVTSFSASLLQGLNGNVYASAKIADVAITDMADNANKMGTSMTMIQNAYQGFAKQNYTMLDNLKLGYGGTKEEMQRLVLDASELNDAIKSPFEDGSLELDNIILAINTIQKNMGITGTTAKEAAATITGSLAMTKSAWKNLTVGIANENANIEELIDEFVESVGIAAENIIPRVEVALVGAGEMVERLLPVIVDRVPQIINEVLPDILQSAASIVQNLVRGLSENSELIASATYGTVSVIVKTIGDLLPEIFSVGIDMLLSLASGIVENVDQITTSAVEVITKIVEALTNPESLGSLLDAAITIILAIADGLIEALPQITDASISVITKIVNTLTEEETLSNLIDAAVEIIIAIADGLINSLDKLTEAAISIITRLVEELTEEDTLDKLVDAAITILETMSTGLIDNLPALVDAAMELVTKLVEYILETDNLTKLIDASLDLVEALATGMIDAAGTLAETTVELIEVIVESFVSMDWGSVGGAIVRGIVDGMVNSWTSFVEKHGDLANALVNGVSTFNSGGYGNALPGTLPGDTVPSVRTEDVKAFGNALANGASVFAAGGYGNAMVGAFPAGSHASGLDYVPYDGYVAELHKGEMVVPAAESRYLRSGGLGSANAEVLQVLERILYAVQDQDNKSISLSVNNREFARMVKAVT